MRARCSRSCSWLLLLLSVLPLAAGCPWERDNPLDGEGTTPPVADGGGTATIPGTWATLSAGSFYMGSPSTEPCRADNEDRHRVNLTRGFRIMIAEVTQSNFQAVMGYNPSTFQGCGGSCPVEGVNWHMAAAYCVALSKIGGRDQCYTCSGSGASVACTVPSAYSGTGIYDCAGYRLPTEAEWEYAYRAGTSNALYNGEPDSSTCKSCTPEDTNVASIARYCGNNAVSYPGCADKTADGMGSCVGTSPVQGRQKNAWELYDMAGNVNEWCHDLSVANLGTAEVTDPVTTESSSTKRIVRGGGWLGWPTVQRAASRLSSEPAEKYLDVGFRVVRGLPK